MLSYLPGELILVTWWSPHQTIRLQWLLLAQALHEVRIALPLTLEEVVDDLLCQLVHIDATCEIRRVGRGAHVVWRFGTAKGAEAGRLPVSRGGGALGTRHQLRMESASQ